MNYKLTSAPPRWILVDHPSGFLIQAKSVDSASGEETSLSIAWQRTQPAWVLCKVHERPGGERGLENRILSLVAAIAEFEAHTNIKVPEFYIYRSDPCGVMRYADGVIDVLDEANPMELVPGRRYELPSWKELKGGTFVATWLNDYGVCLLRENRSNTRPVLHFHLSRSQIESVVQQNLEADAPAMVDRPRSR